MTIDPRAGSAGDAFIGEATPVAEWLWLAIGLAWLVVAIAGEHLVDRLRDRMPRRAEGMRPTPRP